MQILRANKAGFCFGVKRALELAFETIAEPGTIYSLGPLIHNPQVVTQIEQKGVQVIDDVEEAGEGTIILRSHGVGPEVLEKAAEKGIKIVNATCPFVKRAQKIARDFADKDYQVVVIGEKKHPEVRGIVG
ncbi:MAG TPA: bifunctional 4-hydroxy-3-methylbut-2-enyl diphosphate reductase/30S ribosomal protein S1, partial [Clostridia bacterium]|nr:bifunctional 4-hydroxy-3-methylbut-2-enyl diphosphate reductase/30S ribosomal protein S1 [Clostridia bacterium]